MPSRPYWRSRMATRWSSSSPTTPPIPKPPKSSDDSPPTGALNVRSGSIVLCPVTENWNHALSRSRGDYLVMIGDDDALLPAFFDDARCGARQASRAGLHYLQRLHVCFSGFDQRADVRHGSGIPISGSAATLCRTPSCPAIPACAGAGHVPVQGALSAEYAADALFTAGGALDPWRNIPRPVSGSFRAESPCSFCRTGSCISRIDSSSSAYRPSLSGTIITGGSSAPARATWASAPPTTGVCPAVSC